MFAFFPSLITSFSGVLAGVQCTAIADGIVHHVLESWVNLSVRRVSLSVVIVICLFTTISASAQLSFTSAVDLALQNSPRVKMAQDDLNKATASLSESKAVFIPSLSGSIGAGPSYGITTSVPTIFTLNAQSLAFNFSQFDYIRAARAGVQAASATLVDVREQVEEDTAITYISLDRVQQRQKAMSDEYGYAVRLVSIVQLRLDAGMESQLELKQARRTALQIKLQQEQLEDEVASLHDHFSQLIGLPADQLGTVSSSIPSRPSSLLSSTEGPNEYPDTPSVLSAEANALAKRKQAIGDSHNTWRPQIAFSAQYGRISPFNGAATYYNLNGNYNTAYAAAQVQLPFFDSTRKAKARESLAEAQHAEHTVEFLREQQSATRVKLQHSITELETKAELAEVDQGIAQDQLDAMLVRLTFGNGTGSTSPMTPKDEMNARILERQRYLEMLDATFQLRKQQIYLLRQTGQLQNWIQSVANVQPTTPMKPVTGSP
ncbi:TolC family protein [Granulicella sp. WH15]|uniref:TolC family protein n=1 Tax=Granulicella sp. WH15 TaxID=2602070 RepID=UPI001366CB33|nr:TolC family protein [Granulicella sp. WH15]QHN04740.1 TolC family protein [Granulicella sp. WH15]